MSVHKSRFEELRSLCGQKSFGEPKRRLLMLFWHTIIDGVFGQLEDHMRFSGNVFGVPAEFGDHYKAGAPTNQLRTLVLVFPPLVLSSSPHDTPAISRESKKLRGEKGGGGAPR